MKAKLVLILLVVALLCASIASAGVFDWVTGKVVSLKSLLQKSPANTVSPVTADKTVAATNNAPSVKKTPAPTEFDISPVQFSGDVNVLLTHVDNRLRQMENSLKLVATKGMVKA